MSYGIIVILTFIISLSVLLAIKTSYDSHKPKKLFSEKHPLEIYFAIIVICSLAWPVAFTFLFGCGVALGLSKLLRKFFIDKHVNKHFESK